LQIEKKERQNREHNDRPDEVDEFVMDRHLRTHAWHPLAIDPLAVYP
jgi:hypothetical protein